MQNMRFLGGAVIAGLLAVVAVLLIGSCSVSTMSFSKSSSFGRVGEAGQGSSTVESITLRVSDSGRVVNLTRGQRLEVRLPANATTGFIWVVAENGGLAQLGGPTHVVDSEPGVVGADGVTTFDLEAVAVGTGDLTLEYRRPWEKNLPAEKTWSVTVTVE